MRLNFKAAQDQKRCKPAGHNGDSEKHHIENTRTSVNGYNACNRSHTQRAEL